jgi:hypothetical protein
MVVSVIVDGRTEPKLQGLRRVRSKERKESEESEERAKRVKRERKMEEASCRKEICQSNIKSDAAVAGQSWQPDG